MRNPLIFFGLAVALLLALPLLVAARPGDGRVLIHSDDGRHVVVRGDEFTEEDWEEFEAAMDELGESLGSMFEDLDLQLDFDFGDHHGRYAFDHDSDSFDRLGERMGRLGERLAERFGRWDDDVSHHEEYWDDFGDRLSDQIQRQVHRDVIQNVQRDVARAMSLATRDIDRFDFDGDLSAREAREVRRHIERQMRRLEREMERLQERLSELEDQ